jgi:hypothetical protein
VGEVQTSYPVVVADQYAWVVEAFPEEVVQNEGSVVEGQHACPVEVALCAYLGAVVLSAEVAVQQVVPYELAAVS